MKKIFHIMGGGTESRVMPHLSLNAPARGNTARQIASIVKGYSGLDAWYTLNLTRMADPESKMITNDDVSKRVDGLIAEYGAENSIVIMSCAMIDYGRFGGYDDCRYSTDVWPRLQLDLAALPKVIGKIREKRERKAVYLVGFKQVHWGDIDEERGTKEEAMAKEGLKLIKNGHVNLVVVNDSKMNRKGIRDGLIITPEEGVYGQGLNRRELLELMVDMANLRSRLTFTETRVERDEELLIPWDSPRIPMNVKFIVSELIRLGAYRNPLGGPGPTPGHFGIRLDEGSCLSTIRGSDFRTFNQVNGAKLVHIQWDKNDFKRILAFGAKPSVGGQSQRLVFDRYSDYESVIHFHGRLKSDRHNIIVTQPQKGFECGSHECGANTVKGLDMGSVWLPGISNQIRVTMLDKHGPNILIKKDTPPELVMNFIKANFTWE